ncbi:MAG TPA: PilN domain-containing protein [Steroidobacteraceae bacterium]|jgi:type IV pilus assembly protein PilN|nr:PilN domain-containing protein [Steroidobacteraceae bacterium]
MPRINLLPWRDEQRKERQVQFMIGLVGATLIAGLLAFLGYLMFNSMIDGQQRRNDRLRTEIKSLDKQIEEINSLEASKQNFIARMEIIEKLQHARPEIVHVFDEIVKTLPDGTYLTGIKQTDQKFRFDGVAQSSTRVSAFMRNIESSQWLMHPELEVVQADASSGGQSFTVFADEVPNGGDTSAEPAPRPTPGVSRTGVRRGIAP